MFSRPHDVRSIVLFAFTAAIIGCADQAIDDDDIDLYPTDRSELADESVPDEVDGEAPTPDELAICTPDRRGEVTRLSVDANGRVRARGVVSSEFGNCHVSINIRLTRDGTRIDSQNKFCDGPSCKSRLLSAGNPAGAQRFCATVHASATGSLLDRECITR